MLDEKRYSLSHFSIVIMFTVAVILGLNFIPLISVSLNPSNSLPSITINYSWFSASSRIIEQEVTSKLEASLNTISGIKKINSVSQKAYASISVEFDKDVDLDLVRFEIASIIRRVYSKFPNQVSYPTISLDKPGDYEDKPLLAYTLNASYNSYFIKKYAEDNIQSELSLIEGVYKVEINGATPYEYIIIYDNSILNLYKITTLDIKKAVENYLSKKSIGITYYVEDGIKKTINVVIKGYKSNKTVWGSIPIKKIGNRIIYLNDICKIQHKEQNHTNYFRINGMNTVNIIVYSNKYTNDLLITKRIKNKLSKITNKLPKGFKLINTFDSTEYIIGELEKIIMRTIYTVAILLLFVLIISRNHKYLLLILFSLIANLSIAFIFYYIFKIEIHLYSLAGITVSMGLIIDNTVVMIDHLKYYNNKNVFLPIFASTLTSIASLCIIFYLDDDIKLNLIDFAIIIIVNLMVSLIVSLFLVPALMQYINVKNKTNKNIIKRKRIIYKLSNFYLQTIIIIRKFKIIFIIIIILSFGLPVYLLPNKIVNESWYSNLYNKTLGNETYVEKVKPYVNKFLGGSLRLFNYYVFENSNYSKKEATKLYVIASAPTGSTIEQLNNSFMMIESYLSRFKEIDKYITRIQSRRRGTLTIYFKKEFEKSSFPFLLKSRLVNKSMDLGGIRWNISGVGRMFSNGEFSVIPSFAIAVYGYNYDELGKQIDNLKKQLSIHPRVQNIKTSVNLSLFERYSTYDEYFIDINKEILANSDISLLNLANKIKQNTINNYPDIELIIDNNYERISFLSKQAELFDLWSLKNSLLKINKRYIKLDKLSQIKKQKSGEAIIKENQQYVRVVEFDYIGAEKFANKHINKVLTNIKHIFPLGYTAKRLEISNLIPSKDTKIPFVYIILIIVIIYFISAILLESLTQPFSVVFMIPISFIGVFLTFYLFDFNFDQGGYASFVLLSGITVNSSLYIINDFNIFKKKYNKRTLLTIYIKAFNNKVVPIFLTIISTVLGLIPFIIDGQNEVFWFALAIGTIGGLVFSIIGIIIYLPIIIRLNVINEVFK